MPWAHLFQLGALLYTRLGWKVSNVPTLIVEATGCHGEYRALEPTSSMAKRLLRLGLWATY